MTTVSDLRRHAELASATQHIVQAFETSGLGNKAFAEWLRGIAKDIEHVGERAISGPADSV